MKPSFEFSRRLAAIVAAALSVAAGARANGCDADAQVLACHDLGEFTASALRISLADRPLNGSVSIRRVSTIVRLRNSGQRPIVLAYRVGSEQVSDDAGNAYQRENDARKVSGIGLVQGSRADPQLLLQPGQSREVRFDAEKSYRTHDGLPGREFAVGFTLVALRPEGGGRIGIVRDYAVSLAGLRPPPLAASQAAAKAADALEAPLRQLLHGRK